ncbi:MAG: LysR family transcriptional regulator [Rickettsiales bacterium]|nr:LysR family transcriptional regulator [Rickettsiales bacterium]
MTKNIAPLTLSLLKHIYIFHVCAKNLNFTKAANELFLTQSAISKSIKKLETNLKIELFIRNQNYIILSKNGENLFNNTKHLFQEVENNLKLLNNKNDGSDEITFSTVPSCPNFWLNEIISEFSQTHKRTKIKVNIFNGNFDASNVDNEITICCLKDPSELNKHYKYIKLFDEDLVPICRPSLKKKFSSTNELLKQAEIISHSSRENFWHNILSEHNLSLDETKNNFELEHYYMIIDTVKYNDFIGLAPKQYIKNLLKSNILTIAFDTNFKSPYSFYLCTNKNTLNSSNLRFIDWYQNKYSKQKEKVA